MEPTENYDPTDDLALQRLGGSLRIPLGFMLATALFELGGFLQLGFVSHAELWFRAWTFGKLVLAFLGLYTVVRASRLREGSHALWTGVSCVIAIESVAWLVFTFSNALVSCFAPLAVLTGAITLFAIPGLAKANVAAAAARERLAANGIDDAF